MSRIDDLVRELCPGGVRRVAIGELGDVYGGLSGKGKADFSGGNARYVSYMNVYRGTETDVSPEDRVVIRSDERQNRVAYGDILFTGSSEQANECGMSSAVTSEPPDPLYLNSFCFGFRPRDLEELSPHFAKHLFRSSSMRAQITRSANGVTRFNVSKARFRLVEVPVPPPAIQQEIVAILDKMEYLQAELETELETELELRVRQHGYYRDSLMKFTNEPVEWRPMGEVGEFLRGRRFTKADYVDEGVPCMHYGDIYTQHGTATSSVATHVRPELAASLRYAEYGDVVMVDVGETVDDVGKAVAWLGTDKVAIHDHCFAFRHPMNPSFVSHYMQTSMYRKAKAKYVARTKVKTLLMSGLAKVLIPVPSAEDQERIVTILDAFDSLVSDISLGLPAEIAARRKQYAHYRDNLLTFDEAA